MNIQKLFSMLLGRGKTLGFFFVGFMALVPLGAHAMLPALIRANSAGLPPIRFGVQLYPNSASQAGYPDTSNSDYTTGATAGVNQWSEWAFTGSDSTKGTIVNPTTARLLFYVPSSVTTVTQDFRLCGQMASSKPTAYSISQKYSVDESTIGTAACTPWLSEGGGGSPAVSNNTFTDPDYTRVMIETRALPADKIGLSVPRVKAGIMINKVTSLCANMQQTVGGTASAYTTNFWFERGGVFSASSPTIYTTYPASPMNCYRIFLTPTMTTPPTPSAGQAVLGLQAFRSDDKTPGSALFTKSGWTDWVSAPDNADIDRARVFLKYSPSITSRNDFRFCLRVSNTTQLANAGTNCTPWASDVAGKSDSYIKYSDWTYAVNGTGTDGFPRAVANPNYLQVEVETRPMPENAYITDLKVRVDVAELGTPPGSYILGPWCDSSGSVSGGTDWTSTNPNWSSWATDANDWEPDCYRLSIDAKKEVLPDLAVQMRVRDGNGNTITQIVQGEPAYLEWSATGADSCTTALGDFATGGATTGSAEIDTATIGSKSFGIACGSSYNQVTGTWQVKSETSGSTNSCGAILTYPQTTRTWPQNCPTPGTSCSSVGSTCSNTVYTYQSGVGNENTSCTTVAREYSCEVTPSATTTLNIVPAAQLPDLTASLSPIASVEYGVPVTITGTVRNVNLENAQGPITDTFYICRLGEGAEATCDAGYDQDRIMVTTPTILANQSVSRSTQYTFTALEPNQMYRVKFCADATDDTGPGNAAQETGTVTETSDANNCSAWQVFMPQPVLSLSVAPFIVKKGAQAAFTWSAQGVAAGNPSTCHIVSVTPSSLNFDSGWLSESPYTLQNITTRSTYVLSCSDLNGEEVRSQPVEIRIAPSLSEF